MKCYNYEANIMPDTKPTLLPSEGSTKKEIKIAYKSTSKITQILPSLKDKLNPLWSTEFDVMSWWRELEYIIHSNKSCLCEYQKCLKTSFL